jgi:hypothetical protein
MNVAWHIGKHRIERSIASGDFALRTSQEVTAW